MTTPSDLALKQFAAALVGLVLGQIAGDKSIVVAKLFLYLWNWEEQYKLWHVTQASLVVIIITAFIGVIFGAFMVKRGWVNENQIVLSMVTAIFIALFVIIDQSLPTPLGESGLPFRETLYYVFWFIILWLIPGALLPNPEQSFARRIRLWGGMVAVLSVTALTFWLAGTLTIQGAVLLESIIIAECTVANSGDPRKFWLASPSIVNPICAALTVVALAPIWWRTLWSDTGVVKCGLWSISFIVFGIFYAGLFGGFLYAERGWAKVLVNNDVVSRLEFFTIFGSLPIIVVTVVILTYLLTRIKEPAGAAIRINWQVAGTFWWLLPVCMAASFGSFALLGLAPIVRLGGACQSHVWVLAGAHTMNGFIFGLIFRISEAAITWFRPLLEHQTENLDYK